jgi:hypothetical protein
MYVLSIPPAVISLTSLWSFGFSYHLTLGICSEWPEILQQSCLIFVHGNWKIQTLPKSSPAAILVLSALASTELMSVPSAPAGKTPITSQPSLQVDVSQIEGSLKLDEPSLICTFSEQS